ncbi:MAG: lysylphosphatidylglycerol synthase transmembrane domain-containing protein [bacterium]|nr:lysylphosphatidylglycerol synthase transmembrane domain-containing protein [bacterium]
MKNKIYMILRLVIGISILLYVLTSIQIGETADYAGKSLSGRLLYNIVLLKKQILGIDKPLFTAGITLILLSYIISFVRWYFLLKVHDIDIPFGRVISLGFIGVLFNNVMPSTVGGDIVKAYYAAKDTSKRAAVVTTVLVDRIIGMGSLLLISVAAAPFFIFDRQLKVVSMLLIAIFIFSVIVFWLALHPKLMQKISLLKKGRMSGKFIEMYKAFYFYKDKTRVLVWSTVMSVVLQMMMIYVQYIFIRAMGYKGAHFGDFLILIPAITYICAIPISIMGWGVGEAAYKALFNLVGIANVYSVGLSLISRISMMAINLIGLPLYMNHKPTETLKEIKESVMPEGE